MVRDVAVEILNLIKNNEGIKKSDICENFNINIQKIIDIILSECRCSIIDEKGNYSRFGSSTDIRIIKILIQIFLSDQNQIPPEVVSMALTKEGVFGPFKAIDIKKTYSEENKFCDIEMEELFPKEFNVNIFEKNSKVKEDFINEILKPYVKSIIYEDEILMSKSPIGAYISKSFSYKPTDEELLKELISILKENINSSSDLVENIGNYIYINIMNNKFFKTELISRTLDATELQKLGKIYTGFSSLVESMAYETLQMIEMRSFPYGELISIKDTFYTVVAVLIALSTNLENINENDILNKIEEVNRNYNVTNKNKNNQVTKYRTQEVNSNKYCVSEKFVSFNDIPKAMKNLCKMIKVLLEKKNEIEAEEYLKEVIRIHYRFIRIQPFEKANGRTARAIVNMLLQSKGLIGIFRKEKRKEYIEYINDIDRNIKQNEEKYICNLIDNPIECIEIEKLFFENSFLEKDLPFLVIKA